jgi:hypothetical protein
LTAELQASLTRENVLRKQKHDLSQRRAMLAQEYEHRIRLTTENFRIAATATDAKG